MKNTILNRIISMLLAVLMVFSLAACDSNTAPPDNTEPLANNEADGNTEAVGKVDATEPAEPQEINIQLVFWGAEPPTENTGLYKEIEEDLNIRLNINYTMAASAEEKTNTMLVGGNLPDVMLIINEMARSELMEQAAKGGMFWDLTDYLDDYPYLKENVGPFVNSMSFSGQIIGIPRRTLYRAGGMLLREDWLETLNLEVPQTLDDFYNVFYQFTYGDPDGNGVDDTTGLALFGGPYVRPLMLAAGIEYDYYVDEATQTVKNFCTDPNFQTYLDFMKKLYDEGLVSQDFAAMNAVQGREAFCAQKAGAYAANFGNIYGSAYDTLFANNPDARITCILDVKDSQGNLHSETSLGYYGMYVIPKSSVTSEEELRGILEYYNYICTPEITTKYAVGIEGVHYEIDAQGNFKWLDEAGKNTVYAYGVGASNVAPLIATQMEMGLYYNSTKYFEYQSKDGVIDHTPVTSWFRANTDDAAVSTVVQEEATRYVLGEATAEDVAAAVNEWITNGGQSKLDDWTAQYRAMP